MPNAQIEINLSKYRRMFQKSSRAEKHSRTKSLKSNHMASKAWDEVMYQFPNFHGATLYQI